MSELAHSEEIIDSRRLLPHLTSLSSYYHVDETQTFHLDSFRVREPNSIDHAKMHSIQVVSFENCLFFIIHILPSCTPNSIPPHSLREYMYIMEGRKIV
jgi:hypothetical protein